MGNIYFLADLHLGAAYYADKMVREKEAVAFLDSIKHKASELYLLGDILDYWFEYKHVVPRGYVRFFGKLAELSDSGIKITWIIGNHDIWIFDYLPSELGIRVVDGVLNTVIKGTSFCIQHGDALVGTKKFKILRSFFRNRFCQKLYSGIHPRWSVGFAYSCSRRSRKNEKNPDQIRENYKREIKEWCESEIRNGNNARYFLFGHLHLKYEIDLLAGRKLIVLPAFNDNNEYGEFDGESFQIRKFEKKPS